MSMFKQMVSRYAKSIGTSENQRDDALRTRYYKANFSQVFQTAEEIVKTDTQCSITSSSKDHGELSFEVKRKMPMFVTITVITTKPFETAVDIHISTESFSLLGAKATLKEELLRFYQKMDQKHPFIGIGVNGNR